MIELVATIIITASSILLFGYWFRYTCLLILNTKTSRDYAAQIATANQLGFLNVQSQLANAVPDMDRLRDALDRDYAILARLLKTEGTPDGAGMEQRMLDINYRLMGAWYRISATFSATTARKALEEMSMIVAHVANTMGEQAACSAAA